MTFAFAGKGGVGKTTISCAAALTLSDRGKTLLVSTDFMSSIPHILPERTDNLDILELNEDEVGERWKKKYGKDVMSIVDEFFEVDDSILDHIAKAPGVAEEFVVSEIMEIERSGRYRYVIWDTAASSSTMHLLLLQREFYSHLDRDLRFALSLRDRLSPKKILKLIGDWKLLAENVWNWLKNANFIIVITPDELSRLQGEKINSDLRSMGLNVKGYIYNRTRDSEPCGMLCIPELSGSASDIVLEVENLMREEQFPLRTVG